MMRKVTAVFLGCVAGMLVAIPCRGGERVTVRVATSRAIATIPEDALGVSYETSRMLPDEGGRRYFSPENQALVKVFKTLGIRSLRVGGNSVDAKEIGVPGEEDVVALFEFAKAAGVKVIYSFRLQDGNPGEAARVAKVICDRYAEVVDSFAIGNEPSYYKDYTVYARKWGEIRDAVVAVFPGARFCGPDQNPDPVLVKKMVGDFGDESGRLVQTTWHNYPFGCAYRIYKPGDAKRPDAAEGVTLADGRLLVPFDGGASREAMLSEKAYETYEAMRKSVAEAMEGSRLTYRLTEVNGFWFSGLERASDRCAAALWGLEYAYWWVAHGAAGVNFHTGDRTGGAVSMPCRYAAFVSSGKGYEVRPLGSGMKMFDLGGHGRVVETTVSSPAERGVVAYGTVDGEKVFVTVINKSHGAGAEGAEVRIELDTPGVGGARADAIFMTFNNGDVGGGSSDVKVGGARIEEDGSWKGEWAPLAKAEGGSGVEVTVPPVSAVVVRLVVR